MSTILTHEAFEAILVKEEYDAAVRNQIQGWIARGDVVVAYENHDLGHYLLGLHVLVSWGSEAAQLPASVYPTVPEFCPVNTSGGGMGWRYVLVGTYPGGTWPYQEEAP